MPLKKRADRKGWRRDKGPRVVKGLLEAALSPTSPHATVRLFGSQAKGKAYERRLGKELERRLAKGLWDEAELIKGPWIKFRDQNGPGYAQPDFLILSPALLCIIDAKLTHTEIARRQLLSLYLPLCSFLWPGRLTLCVEVCHNPGTGSGFLVELEDCLAEEQDLYIWHWLG